MAEKQILRCAQDDNPVDMHFRLRTLEQKQDFRHVLEMVRGGFVSGKKPLDSSDPTYTYSAFAIAIDRGLLQALAM